VLAGVLLHILLSAVSPPRDAGLWLLERSERQPAEGALLEALRIYTRDLDVPISIRRIPAGIADEESKSEFALRHCVSEANLVLWWKADNSSLRVLYCANKQEEDLPVSATDELPVTVQTLALKVRGLLVEAMAAEKIARSRKVAPPTNLGSTLPLSPSKAPDTVVAAKALSLPPPARLAKIDRGVEAGAAYTLGTTTATEGFRQGLSLRLGVVFSSWPAALEVNGMILSRVTRAAAQNTISVRDVPFAISLSPRLERGKWLFSAGLRAGIHFLTTEAKSWDGRPGASQNLSFGLGTVEQIRYAIWQQYCLHLAFSNEALFPKQRFTLDHQEALQIGRLQWNLSLGAVVRL